MDITRLSPALSVSPQITPGDLPAIRAAGFRSILCNRPDGESGDQPTFAALQAAAEAEGLRAAYLPVTPINLNAASGRAFGKLLDDLPGPVLAFCRSGARSSQLWMLSRAARAKDGAR